MPWIFYTITGLVLITTTIITEKYLIEKRIKYAETVIVLYGWLTFFFSLIILVIKGLEIISFLPFLFVFSSGILITWYLIPYFKALALDDASRIIPFFQSIPIFTLILSSFFLGETLTEKQLIGFFIIVFGGFVLSVEKFDKNFFIPRKSLWFMLFSSLLYSLSTVLFKASAVNINFWSIFIYQSWGAAFGAVVLFFYPPNKKNILSDFKKIKFSTLLTIFLSHGVGFSSEGLIYYAITLAPVALVSVLGGLQPLILLIYTTILSLFFPHIIKEDLRKSTMSIKLFAMVILFLGIYLIYL